MVSYLCFFCDKFEKTLIAFSQKRHDECRIKAKFIQEKNRFWSEFKGININEKKLIKTIQDGTFNKNLKKIVSSEKQEK